MKNNAYNIFRKIILLNLCWVILWNLGCQPKNVRKIEALVIVNSHSPEYIKGKELLLPYIDHFGIPYILLDIASEELSDLYSSYPLIILAHPMINYNQSNMPVLNDFLNAEIFNGSGLVCFDPDLKLLDIEPVKNSNTGINHLVFTDKDHYILHDRSGQDTLNLFGKMNLSNYNLFDYKSLIEFDGRALLSCKDNENGKIALWTSMDWMHSDVLGPLGGLDDCLWRSLVWASKKPFVMHVMPSIVTMRVDDVAGRGQIWNKTPLYWVKTANKYGFKPWLGLFIYNLTPEGIDELRDFILAGNATASPHAFGRPNRHEDLSESYIPDNPLDTISFYYNPEAMPLRSETYDEFIFFDHHNEKPWPDIEVERGFQALQKWYKENEPLPISKLLLPHWYELGHNTAPYVKDFLKSKFVALAKPVDVPYGENTDWLVSGPFRLSEKPGTSTGWTREGGPRPVYYADFMQLGNIELFNCLTEIRDDAGYEWAPDNDVEVTVGRGVRQLRRAFDSRALAVLFTHETDYVYLIEPENWDKELELISEAISASNPIYMTMDDALAIVKAYVSSNISSIEYDVENHNFLISFEGDADVETWIQIFTEDENIIESDFKIVPPFFGSNQISVN